MRACTEANYITERAGKASGKPSGAAELAWGAVIGAVRLTILSEPSVHHPQPHGGLQVLI